MNSRTAIGVVLAFCGVLMVLKLLGFSFGPIFGILFPLILIGLGIVGIKNDKKIIGGTLLAIGAIVLLSKLWGLIFLLLAIGLIVAGVSMFKRNKRVY